MLNWIASLRREAVEPGVLTGAIEGNREEGNRTAVVPLTGPERERRQPEARGRAYLRLVELIDPVGMAAPAALLAVV